MRHKRYTTMQKSKETGSKQEWVRLINLARLSDLPTLRAKLAEEGFTLKGDPSNGYLVIPPRKKVTKRKVQKLKRGGTRKSAHARAKSR